MKFGIRNSEFGEDGGSAISEFRAPNSEFRFSRLTVWFLIAALLAWVFAGVLVGGGLFAYRDAAHYYYPLFQFVQEQWSAGGVPLWNPQENLGAPLLANPTASVLYPGKLVFLLPLEYAWNYRLYTIGHVLLAALGAYALARRWNASCLAAGVAAISYAFCGNVLFQYCNVVYLVGAAWLPMACLAADHMLLRRSLGGAILLGIVLALMVLGGDPQAAYHAGLLAILYALLEKGDESSFLPRTMPALARACSPRSRPALLLLAAATALLLAAVQILPSIEFNQLSGRSAITSARNIYELPAQLVQNKSHQNSWSDGLLCRNLDPETHQQQVYQFSVAPWRLAEYLWPNIGGRQFPIHRRWLDIVPAEGRVWVPSLYMGLLPMILAIAAWRLRSGDPRARWMSWTALLAILASLGWYGLGWLAREILAGLGVDPARAGVGSPVGGLYWLLTVLLPGYIYFRYPAKLLVVAALALSLLAAQGWDRFLVSRSRGLRHGLLWLAGISAAGVVAALALRPFWSTWMAGAAADPVFGPLDALGAHWDLTSGFAQTTVLSLALFVLLGLPDRVGWMPAAALVLVAADLAIANGWLIACVPAEIFHRPPAVAAVLETQGSPLPLAKEGPGVRAACTQQYPPQANTPSQPYRISREEIWVPSSWAQRSSPRRMAELVRWCRDSLWPNYQLGAGLSLTNVPTSMVPQDYRAVLLAANNPDNPVIPGSPVTGKYAIRHSPPRPTGAQRVEFGDRGTAELEDVSLWYFPDHLPRAWVVHDLDVLPPLEQSDPQSVQNRTREVFWPRGTARDLRHTAAVETTLPAESFPRASAGLESEACRIVDYQPLRVEIEAELRQPGLVVLCDQFYPGWTLEVTSDGQASRRMPILRTNRVMRGVWLEAGSHRLVYRYRPTGFVLGAGITVMAWLGLLAMAVIRGVGFTHQ